MTKALISHPNFLVNISRIILLLPLSHKIITNFHRFRVVLRVSVSALRSVPEGVLLACGVGTTPFVGWSISRVKTVHILLCASTCYRIVNIWALKVKYEIPYCFEVDARE